MHKISVEFILNKCEMYVAPSRRESALIRITRFVGIEYGA
jgi:hypothetical protein